MDAHKHHLHMLMDFKRRFYVLLILTAPILTLDPLIGSKIGISGFIPGVEYILLILATFVFFYGGKPFFKGSLNEIRKRQPGMMTLIALAVSIAYLYSAFTVFGYGGKPFFWELVTLLDVMLLGHWLEMKSVMGSSRAIEELVRLLPDVAHLVKGASVVDVRTSELRKGDLVLVKPGERIPADGVIVEGGTFVNESMLTGEATPVRKEKGDKVVGGSVNGDGIIKVRITGTGEESYLSKIIRLVREAQASKSRVQRIVDRAAFALTLIAIGAGSSTLLYWLLSGESLGFAVERAVTVMVITCPHALGLAVPLVVAISTAMAARNGLLIRNRNAFENIRKITTIVFDKTGTLTEGEFGVKSIKVEDPGLRKDEVLAFAAALERYSEHPIARAIVSEALRRGLNIPDASAVEIIKGQGIKGKVGEHEVWLLSPRAARERGIIGEFEAEATSTPVLVFLNRQLKGIIYLSDRIREGAREAIRILKESGIKCWMLTGDNKMLAEKIAKELGLDGYFAEVLPHEKREKIEELQKRSEFVAMVGDGINDAPAIAQADVGIAIGSGTEVAGETADIILVRNDLRDILRLLGLGKASYSKMIQNLAWATGYNSITIPLAAGALYKTYGILIPPAVGALLMSLSTVIVVINARLLKNKSF